MAKKDEQEVGLDGLTEGRIVHYILEGGPSKGQHRPAVVVNVWRDNDGRPTGLVQLQVFTDSNPEGQYNDNMPSVTWRTSIRHDELSQQEGAWHWPEPASWSIKEKTKEKIV